MLLNLTLNTNQSILFSGQLVSTLANLEGEESFDAAFLGQAEEVLQERICDDELCLIKGCVFIILIYLKNNRNGIFPGLFHKTVCKIQSNLL